MFSCINEYRSKNAFNFNCLHEFFYFFFLILLPYCCFHLIMFNFVLLFKFHLCTTSVFNEVFNQSIGHLNLLQNWITRSSDLIPFCFTALDHIQSICGWINLCGRTNGLLTTKIRMIFFLTVQDGHYIFFYSFCWFF